MLPPICGCAQRQREQPHAHRGATQRASHDAWQERADALSALLGTTAATLAEHAQLLPRLATADAVERTQRTFAAELAVGAAAGDQLGEALQALLASGGGSGGGRARRPARFARSAHASAAAAGGDGSGDGSGESSASGSDSSGWWTDEESGSDGAADAPAPGCACFIRRAWLSDVYQQTY